MYKNNWLKRGAVAAVAAGLMLGALPGVAMAEDAQKGFTEFSNPTITKTWNYGNSTIGADASFNFQLSFVSMTAPGTLPTVTPDFATGADGKVAINVADATPNDTDKVSTGSKKLIDFVSEYQFTSPGSYFFKLAETDKTDGNIKYDGKEYDVRVDVVWADGANPGGYVQVAGCYVLTNKGEENEAKEDKPSFENSATAASDPLTVTKDVQGNFANTSDWFEYTLKLENDGEAKLTGSYEISVNGEKVVLNSDGNYQGKFYLQDGDEATVSGLPADVKYTVTETDGVFTQSTAEDGAVSYSRVEDSNGSYKASYKVNNGTSVEGFAASSTINATGDNQVDYVNSKILVPNTGITVNGAAFTAVAAVAAAGAVTLVISRKRRAGEEF